MPDFTRTGQIRFRIYDPENLEYIEDEDTGKDSWCDQTVAEEVFDRRGKEIAEENIGSEFPLILIKDECIAIKMFGYIEEEEEEEESTALEALEETKASDDTNPEVSS